LRIFHRVISLWISLKIACGGKGLTNSESIIGQLFSKK
jgi:hypothetical protein